MAASMCRLYGGCVIHRIPVAGCLRRGASVDWCWFRGHRGHRGHAGTLQPQWHHVCGPRSKGRSERLLAAACFTPRKSTTEAVRLKTYKKTEGQEEQHRVSVRTGSLETTMFYWDRSAATAVRLGGGARDRQESTEKLLPVHCGDEQDS